MHQNKKFALVIILFLNFQLHAQTDKTSIIKNYLDSLNNENLFNGLVLVKSDNENLYFKSGYRDQELKDEITKDNKFALASISKLFYATKIMDMVKENKLKATDLVSKYLPDVPDKSITILDLLNHSSNIEPMIFTKKILKLSKDNSKDEVYQFILKYCFNYIGDSRLYRYANENYFLLAKIIESIEHKPFELVISEHIKTIGLSDSTRIISEVYYTDKNNIIPNMYGKNVTSKNYPKEYEVDKIRENIYGTGDIYTNETDILKFGEYILKLDSVSKSLIYDNCYSDAVVPYKHCFGFELSEKKGIKKNLWHGGYLIGNSCVLIMDEINNRTYFILNTNESDKYNEVNFSQATLTYINKVKEIINQ